MRSVVVLFLVLPVFASPSPKQVDKARSLAIKVANKKYPEKMRRKLEKEASKLFKTRKVGDSLSVMVGARKVSGTIRKIEKRAVYIGNQEVHRMHFPSHLFDDSVARRACREYVESRFDRPRKKCIEKHYQKLVVKK